jgi:hypothetical protein
VLVCQRDGSFSVRNDASHSVTVSWKARGMKAAPVKVLPPPGPSEPVLPPPAPVPSESTEPLGKGR